MLDDVGVDNLAVDDGETVIFDRPDRRYPKAEPEDRLSATLDVAYVQSWDVSD